MKVLGLVGSLRKGSNTDLLVSAILDGAQENHLLYPRYTSMALTSPPALTAERAKIAIINALSMTARRRFIQSSQKQKASFSEPLKHSVKL